jgi:hypothetical protein
VTPYRGRRAVSIDNGTLRVTVLAGGGHIAEVCDLASGVNPLWTPPWPSIEPHAYDPRTHPEYGGSAESSLLSGIMGHNLCLDIFGGPSAEEAVAAMPVHGETSVVDFDVRVAAGVIHMHAVLPAAKLRVERRVSLDGRSVRVVEAVENLTAADRPVGWTEHVTLGPPFLEDGTQLQVAADRSLVYAGQVGPADYLEAGAEFAWPHAPRRGGGTVDLRRYPGASSSSADTRGFSLDWPLGRKPRPHGAAVEPRDASARAGVRRFAGSRVAPRHDRARPPVRHAGVPLDSGAYAGRGALSRRAPARRRHAGLARMIESRLTRGTHL